MFIKYILVLLAGLVAGFINVNAGGGSLLTIPALIFLGLPPLVANGTNRIAILFGAISATQNFKKKKVLDMKFGLLLAVPALFGAIIGSLVVIKLTDQVFNTILSVVMILVLLFIVFKPQNKYQGLIEELSSKKKILTAIAFFFVGLYGGFIQAGVGFVIMITLTLMTGLSLVSINGLKVFVVLIYTIFSLGIFLFHGKVDIAVGLILASGNTLGSYLGSNFAIAKGDKWIKAILIAAVILMAGKLSGLFSFLF
jgi:uncharacterized protein